MCSGCVGDPLDLCCGVWMVERSCRHERSCVSVELHDLHFVAGNRKHVRKGWKRINEGKTRAKRRVSISHKNHKITCTPRGNCRWPDETRTLDSSSRSNSSHRRAKVPHRCRFLSSSQSLFLPQCSVRLGSPGVQHRKQGQLSI